VSVAVVAEVLPPALAGTLTEEQRQAVLEAPREKRLEALAAALSLRLGRQVELDSLPV